MKKLTLLTFLLLFISSSFYASPRRCSGDSIDANPLCDAEVVTEFNQTDFVNSLTRISGHISEASILSATQIIAEQSTIESNKSMLAINKAVMSAAFALVAEFETKKGPLFVAGPTAIERKATGYELEKFMLHLQQHILDYSYTEANILAYPAIFENVKFETSSYFPGAVAAPSDRKVSYVRKINATHVKGTGAPANYEDKDARRPTGCYLAPGSVATVIVPSSLVGVGASILVGAHTWDHVKKPIIKRMDRVSKLYPITSTTVTIANPLGGGIYVNIPLNTSMGVIELTLKNVVRSPYFGNTAANHTTVSDWQNMERNHIAPRADFETEKVMHQVPTSWINKLADPSPALDDWDTAMDGVSEMLGRPLLRSKTVVYQQVDVQMRGGAFFPGYPQGNIVYDPTVAYDGDHDHFLVRGPNADESRPHSRGLDVFFHELGHAEKIYKFKGEIEAFVNFLYVAVYNKKFGVELDTAFVESSSSNVEHTREEAAICWMITENFRLGNPMSSTTGQFRQEFHYQPRGYAKYVDVVDLFGWEAIEDFYLQVNKDYDAGTYESVDLDVNVVPTDPRTLRMSIAAGYDLRPLLHFWGKHSESPVELAADIAASGVKQSAAIYDRLLEYKALVPMTNEAFRAFGLEDFSQSKIDNAKPFLNNIDQSYSERFLTKFWNSYGSAEGQAAKNEVQAIVDLYFPDGRPADDGK